MTSEDRNRILSLKPYIKSLYNYMAKKCDIKEKSPKIIFDNKDLGDGVFIYTAYFDPDTDAIRVFTYGRGKKDCLRSIAHEYIHYFQRVKGDIENSGYSGDKITEDKNLIKLEAEAYLKGNMLFREWTEIEKKKGVLK